MCCWCRAHYCFCGFSKNSWTLGISPWYVYSMRIIVIIAVLVLASAALLLYAGGSRESGGPDYRDPETLRMLIERQDKPHILIDVRTPEEFRGGHIPGAVNIPVDRIASAPPDVPDDSLVIVYCRSGARSAQARRTLNNMGFEQIVDFGGIHRWPFSLDTGR